MKRLLPFPMLSALLAVGWLVLDGSYSPGHLIVAALVGLGVTLALRAVQAPRVSIAAPRAAAELVALVLADVVRSNIAVSCIVLRLGTRDSFSGFVHIPLALTHPVGLAALACIVTATPGTAWARYDSTRSVLVLHVLDLVDEETWIRIIKGRYERRLLEIFR